MALVRSSADSRETLARRRHPRAAAARRGVCRTWHEREAIEKLASQNIVFTGRVDENTKRELLATARGLVFPAEDDFGIVCVRDSLGGALFDQPRFRDRIRGVVEEAARRRASD